MSMGCHTATRASAGLPRVLLVLAVDRASTRRCDPAAVDPTGYISISQSDTPSATALTLTHATRDVDALWTAPDADPTPTLAHVKSPKRPPRLWDRRARAMERAQQR
ncbi:hypothetical protein GSI_02090 [Ganoderma sinense ZZ0214-1]|uniref:Uncharacterized protein n=1 Tax=Ganoderma sinense ZZ0214-1 TaxID=1077348 RepID=A0A2G8SNL8_9APHY|nr:hypothetical protein GSI_02090 [Ganoderma sinense ZZ0214-1]